MRLLLLNVNMSMLSFADIGSGDLSEIGMVDSFNDSSSGNVLQFENSAGRRIVSKVEICLPRLGDECKNLSFVEFVLESFFRQLFFSIFFIFRI